MTARRLERQLRCLLTVTSLGCTKSFLIFEPDLALHGSTEVVWAPIPCSHCMPAVVVAAAFQASSSAVCVARKLLPT